MALVDRARVTQALANTPPEYLAKCLASRVEGPDACGSIIPGHTTETLLETLWSARWRPYVHPDIMDGCTAYYSSIAGRLGVIEIDRLLGGTYLRIEDPKETGFVEAVVETIGAADDSEPNVYFTVIILGPDDGTEVVYTFHPGAPVRPSRVSAENVKVGSLVTREEALGMGLKYAKVRR